MTERQGPDDGAGRGLPAAVLDPARLAAVRSTGLLDSAAQESWDGLTALASRLLRAPLAFMTLVDAERSFWLSCLGVSGQRQNAVEESFCQYVIEDRAPLFIDDTTLDLRTRLNPAVSGMGVRAWAGYPVLDPEGQPLGSFCVVDTVPRTWSEEDASHLGVLARAASSQVALVMAAGAQQRAEARARGLAELATGLLSVDTTDELVQVVLKRGLVLLTAEGGAVVVPSGEEAEVTSSAALQGTAREDVHGSGTAEAPGGISGAAALLATRGRTVLRAGRSSPGLLLPGHDLAEARAAPLSVVVPLTVPGRRLGALVAWWREDRELQEEELDLLDGIAAQCAAALARVSDAQARTEIARQVASMSAALQRSLLTQPPTPDNVCLAVRYVPAQQEAQVGGDWYDAFPDPTGAVLVSVGDVEGHDREAAARMAQLRTLLRGLALDSEDDTATLLTRLDRAAERLDVGTSATALVARVRPDDTGLHVRWSSAGHLPPLLRLRDGSVQVLPSAGDLLLGLDPTTPRTEQTTHLPEGGALLLYTDGLVERRGEDLDVGIERLAVVFGDVGGGHPETVSDELVRALVSDEPDDDVALLLLTPRCPP